jgi:ribosomal protein uS3
MATTLNISKKRKFIADGVFYSEVNELLARKLAEDGYAGLVVKVTSPSRTEIVILATRTQEIIGEKGQRISELTSLVQNRFNLQPGTVELFVEKVAARGLNAQTQAESLKYKLLGGLAVRRACYGVLRFVMESGAKGAEVSVSGKVRGQRAKSQKFADGYMIKSGQARDDYIETAVRHVMMRQGILGVKVAIMLPHDPRGVVGPKTPLSDVIKILEPKDVSERRPY